jgi:hypothetical protein
MAMELIKHYAWFGFDLVLTSRRRQRISVRRPVLAGYLPVNGSDKPSTVPPMPPSQVRHPEKESNLQVAGDCTRRPRHIRIHFPRGGIVDHTSQIGESGFCKTPRLLRPLNAPMRPVGR